MIIKMLNNLMSIKIEIILVHTFIKIFKIIVIVI